jgi:hypothetical protein
MPAGAGAATLRGAPRAAQPDAQRTYVSPREPTTPRERRRYSIHLRTSPESFTLILFYMYLWLALCSTIHPHSVTAHFAETVGELFSPVG